MDLNRVDSQFKKYVDLLGNSRKTGTVSAAPPECLRRVLPVWRRAAEPFGLYGCLRNVTPNRFVGSWPIKFTR